MALKNLAVFGDEFFPRVSLGGKKRALSSHNVFSFLQMVAPDTVYIAPTAGTGVFVSLACKILSIPYILVSPYPGFYDGHTESDKNCMDKILAGAKTVIILNEEKTKSKEEAWKECVEFLTNAGQAIVFLYSENTSNDYNDFMTEYSIRNHQKRILMELVYDSRQIIFE